MTFAKLISSTSWVELKAALLWLFPYEEECLSDYRKVFWELRRMKPRSSHPKKRPPLPGRPDHRSEDDLGLHYQSTGSI